MGFFFAPVAAKPKKTAGAKAPRIAGQKRVVAAKDRSVVPIRVEGGRRKGCTECALKDVKMKHPKMKPSGSTEPLIYVLGGFPSIEDDEEGSHFAGYTGDLIRDYIPTQFQDAVRWSNVVRCRPIAAEPTREDKLCCSQYQVQDIEETKPAIILGFGPVPLTWAIDENKIQDWRGTLIPVRIGAHACWYAPLWQTSFVSRMKNNRKIGDAVFTAYKRDLDRIFDNVLQLNEPFIPQGEELDAGMHWELSWDVAEVEDFLRHMEQFPSQAIDIETNGIRPYFEGAKILSISFGTWDLSYAIPIQHREAQWTPQQLKRVWAAIGEHLRKRHITFSAHNLKFEQEWLSMPFALGRDILFETTWGDTMAQALVLRTQDLHALSLNCRSLALFGIREKGLDNVDVKNLDAEPLPLVLRYNARDTKFTDLVRQIQDTEIEEQGLEQAYAMMVSRALPLALAQQMGVLPNTAFAEAKHTALQTRITELEKKIQALPAVQALIKDTGKPFKSTSPAQLTVLLRDRLKRQEGWRVVDGVRKYSTDEAVLKQIKHPVAQLVVDKRTALKLDSTYVLGGCSKGSFPERDCGALIWADGLIHTNYNHLVASTGRTSSDTPNLQNYPKRKDKDVRNCITAPPGHVMVSVDYGQIEARVIAMASQCPVLCSALWDHYDIHMEWAKIIVNDFPFVLDSHLKKTGGDETKAMKSFRGDMKTLWTFPLFYGSVLEGIAPAFGIPATSLRPHVNRFWEMFSAVRVWQEKTLKLYKAQGYVQMLTGRRRSEPLSQNEIYNTPIQGAASDIVVNAMERLALHAYETRKWQRAGRMNIHDDITTYLPKETLEEDLQAIVEIMVVPPFDFINVPITVEVAIGPSWGALVDVLQVESTEYGFPKRPKQQQQEKR